MKIVRFVFPLFFCFSLHAQHHIQGKVTNIKNQAPLVFANIIVNNNPSSGVITDIDGKFTLTSSEKITSLTCSYIGFETKAVSISQQKTINIQLKPSTNQLEEVVLTNENPAKKIMRKVIAHREENNPENIPSFEYTSYNKSVFDYISKQNTPLDSVFQKVFKNGHLFLMESVTHKKFIAPDLSEETVLANRVSGLKNPFFVSLATDFQPFSFYKQTIPLLDINFLNPISDGALNKYSYHLKETLFQQGDTIHLISFKPQKNKNFEGLKGILYINTKNYAIQNVIASPASETIKMNLKIQQKYTRINGKIWFPEQLNYELLFNNFSEEGQSLKVDGKSYLSDVRLNTNLKRKEFSAVSVKIKADAFKKDSLFWKQYRIKKLNARDLTTYAVLDSIGEKYKLDKFLSYMEKLPEGRLPIGVIDVDLTKTFLYNKYEGFRLGTGLYTNEKLARKVSFGGFFGVGLKDHQWKYGGEVRYDFSIEQQSFLKLDYQDNLVEIGSYGLKTSKALYGGYRDFLISKVDRIQQYELKGGFRTWKYLKIGLAFRHATTTPQKNYDLENTALTFDKYSISAAKLKLRYAFREKLVETPHQLVSMGTNYPVFTLSYSRGLKNLFQSDYGFNKIEARIDQSFFTKNLGETTYRLQAGYIDKKIPLGLLFTGEGSYDKDILFVMKNTFQTMLPYEFLSNRYVDLFFSHNFGSLLFKSKVFRPEVILHQNIGWGNFFEGNDYKSTGFKTQEKGYFESGIELANILKINYLNIGYLGLGAGVFYRYGAYSNESFKDNVAFKINLGFSFD